MIKRLSFGMPPHLLTSFANRLLIGKILASAPATIPIRIDQDDKNLITITEEINKTITSTARTIARSKLSNKIQDEKV